MSLWQQAVLLPLWIANLWNILWLLRGLLFCNWFLICFVSLHLCIITARLNERRNDVQKDIEFILKRLFTTVLPRIYRSYTNRALASFTASVEVLILFFFKLQSKTDWGQSTEKTRMSDVLPLQTCKTVSRNMQHKTARRIHVLGLHMVLSASLALAQSCPWK